MKIVSLTRLTGLTKKKKIVLAMCTRHVHELQAEMLMKFCLSIQYKLAGIERCVYIENAEKYPTHVEVTSDYF